MPQSHSRRKGKGCDGKIAYPTLYIARREASRFAHRRDAAGSPIVSFLRAYACRCGKFHIGSTRRIDWSKVR